MIALQAHAKINWFLRVLGRRDDGYHDIETLMQGIGLYDELYIEPAKELTLASDMRIPHQKNLVYKAAIALTKHVGIREGARIRLVKNIPSAAGLGGGSSDAASTLRGLSELWGLELSQTELLELAAGLGSDVPFFIGAPCAVATGRGERLSPIDMRGGARLLLVKPSFGISSAVAYGGIKSYSSSTGELAPIVAAIEAADGAAMSRLLGNDLETPAITANAEIAELKAALISAGAVFSAMSGSGSTVFGVFEHEDALKKARGVLSARKGLWICATVTL